MSIDNRTEKSTPGIYMTTPQQKSECKKKSLKVILSFFFFSKWPKNVFYKHYFGFELVLAQILRIVFYFCRQSCFIANDQLLFPLPQGNNSSENVDGDGARQGRAGQGS